MTQNKTGVGLRLLAIADLACRWNYTRAGVHKLAKRNDFPSPVAVIGRGRIKIFSEADIMNYENDKPWLLSNDQKISRQYGYFYAKQKE